MRLMSFERRWLLAVFDTILPSGAHPRLSLGARDVPLGRFVDELFRAGAPRLLLGIRVSLWVAALAPLFLLGRMRTLFGLTPPDRARTLDLLRRHRIYVIRETVNVLKAAACLGYAAFPSVRRQVGIEDTGPPAPWAAEEDQGAGGGAIPDSRVNKS